MKAILSDIIVFVVVFFIWIFRVIKAAGAGLLATFSNDPERFCK